VLKEVDLTSLPNNSPHDGRGHGTFVASIAAGKSAAVTLDLTPGKYVFICNVAGHYQLGMHTAFTVEAP
jgi:uncharacterized cupredoxin-like copper-binding protein